MIHHLLRNDCCGIPKSLNVAIWVASIILFLFIGPVVFMWWVRDQIIRMMHFLLQPHSLLRFLRKEKESD